MCNEGFSQYVIESIHFKHILLTRSLSKFYSFLEECGQQSESNTYILKHYSTEFTELLGWLRRIGEHWQLYVDRLDSQANNNYQVSSVLWT